jgi:hypothetical protein
MVTVRLHMDDCDENNGALLRFVRLESSALPGLSRECPEIVSKVRLEEHWS